MIINNLKLNPFLQVFRDSNDPPRIELIAPLPGKSRQSLLLDAEADRELYQKISGVIDTGFAYFDYLSDLDENEVEVFKSKGFLVDETAAIEKPLYSCQLSGLQSDTNVPGELFVSKSFRFEPFNLATLKQWIYERHLSPTQPTVWVEDEVTKIESGYWLTQDEAAVVESLVPGEQFANEIDPEIAGRLYAAGILRDRREFEESLAARQMAVANLGMQFEEKRYSVFENILPDAQIKALQQYYRQYVAAGFMPLGDNHVELRFWEHNEPVARQLHLAMTDLVGRIVGKKIKPSYCFGVTYLEDAVLEPHVDREQCEYSISFQIDYQPEPEDKRSPWALSLSPPRKEIGGRTYFPFKEFESDSDLSGDAVSLYLSNGDGLFYKGRELIHYRRPLPKGHRSTSVFLHYVDDDFEGSLM